MHRLDSLSFDATLLLGKVCALNGAVTDASEDTLIALRRELYCYIIGNAERAKEKSLLYIGTLEYVEAEMIARGMDIEDNEKELS